MGAAPPKSWGKRRHCKVLSKEGRWLQVLFSSSLTLSMDNLQEKEVDENVEDGKGQPSRKEILFHFSSRKTRLSALKLILKPVALSQILHLNFPLQMNPSALQTEKPA